MINLMIVEDNEIVRQSLTKFLDEEQDINVIAEAVDGSTALDKLQSHTDIDVVLADWNMPDMNGLQLTTCLTAQYPVIKTLILTMHSKPEYQTQAKAAGAKGFLLKDGELEDLVAAIRAVATGEVVYR